MPSGPHGNLSGAKQFGKGRAMDEISQLQAEIRSRDICPWCYVPVTPGATGGMERFLLNGVWWHKGCVADNYRTELESQRP